MYKPWKYDGRHRAECRILGRFPEVADSATHPFPWRLTREQVSIVDKRVRDMWWPHHTHRLWKRGASFFVKSSRCWKARDKMTIFMVLLPTVLRGFVPAVHQALLQLVFALRRLEGQVVSSAEAKRLRVVPGSCLVEKDAYSPGIASGTCAWSCPPGGQLTCAQSESRVASPCPLRIPDG